MKNIMSLAMILLLSVAVFATVITDPIGDADPGFIYTHDLTAIEGTVIGTDLLVRLDFNDPITPTNSGANDALYGYVDLFLDQNNPPFGDYCSQVPTRSSWGANRGTVSDVWFLEFFEGEGTEGVPPGFQAILFDGSGNLVGPQPTTWFNDYVEVRVPLATLNDDGILYMGTVVGDYDGFTDCAPEDGHLITDIRAAVPTLSEIGILLFVAAFAVLGLFVLRRKTA